MFDRIVRTGLITFIVMGTMTLVNGGAIVDLREWAVNFLFVWIIAVLAGSVLKR